MIKTNKGFTLIELLAVIVILAIILVIAVPRILNVVQESKINAVEIDAKIVARELQKKVANDPIDLSSLTVDDLKDYGVKAQYTEFKAFMVNGEVQVTLGNGVHTASTFEAKVYGVSWAGGMSSMVRTDDAVGMTFTKNTSTITSDFDNAEIYKDIKEVTDTYGNQFVSIPKFYIKKTVNGNAWTWQISNIKYDEDYYLPACFYDYENNKELPYILVGKYVSNLNGDKLESKTNTFPAISKNISQFRTYARNNNVGDLKGYQLIDIHVIDLLQTLFTIEFATLNSQSIMKGFSEGHSMWNHEVVSSTGNKVTVASSASLFVVGQYIGLGTSLGNVQRAAYLEITEINGNEITYSGTPTGEITPGLGLFNMAYKNGKTDSVPSLSGSLVSNSNGEYPMKYRGIENLYGNIFQMVDGVNFNNYQAYVNLNPNTYQESTFSGDYKALNYVNSSSNVYIIKEGYDSNYPFATFPISGESSNINSFYKDYYWVSSGDKIALFGGRPVEGSYAGTHYWHLTTGPTISTINSSSRLVKKAL